jgi:16S rRNA (guanine966-N2)-methyltransferase
VRESLFAWLPALEGAAVLDLFAGTGALGIEALSRGARRAVFVERARPALDALRANLATLGLEGQGRVLAGGVQAAVARLGREGERFDAIFLDPPYAAGEAQAALAAVARSGLLAPAGTLVLETSWRHPPGDVPGLAAARQRRYGETLVVCYVPGTLPGAGEGGATG